MVLRIGWPGPIRSKLVYRMGDEGEEGLAGDLFVLW